VNRFYLFLLYFLAVPLVIQAGNGLDGMSGAIGRFLNPNAWFNAFREGITIQIPSVGTSSLGSTVKLPTPEETLKRLSPKLQEANTDVREETGIDFAKFFAWLAKVAKAFFGIITGLLESLSQALEKKQ